MMLTARRRFEHLKFDRYDSIDDAALSERRIRGLAGPPLLPNVQFPHLQIVQTTQIIALRQEPESARIVTLDSRGHLSPAIRAWLRETRRPMERRHAGHRFDKFQRCHRAAGRRPTAPVARCILSRIANASGPYQLTIRNPATNQPGGPILRDFAPEIPRRPRASKPREGKRDREGDDPLRTPCTGARCEEARRVRSEDVQHLKSHLSKGGQDAEQHPDGAQRVVEKAVEWNVIDLHAVHDQPLAVPKGSTRFYDFDDFERVVVGGQGSMTSGLPARSAVAERQASGLGEMVALEWGDIDFVKRQMCVQRSAWKGQVASPKGGRLRYVPLTTRLAAALQHHRHLRGPLVSITMRIAADRRSGSGYRPGERRRRRACSTMARTCCGTRSVHIWRCAGRR